MLEIFKIVGNQIAQTVKMWQGISIGGFRPFWYLIGCALLTVFGFFLRGLLFGGAAGGSASKVVSKVQVQVGEKLNKKK